MEAMIWPPLRVICCCAAALGHSRRHHALCGDVFAWLRERRFAPLPPSLWLACRPCPAAAQLVTDVSASSLGRYRRLFPCCMLRCQASASGGSPSTCSRSSDFRFTEKWTCERILPEQRRCAQSAALHSRCGRLHSSSRKQAGTRTGVAAGAHDRRVLQALPAGNACITSTAA